MRWWSVALFTVLVLVPLVQAVPGTVFRINPVVGSADPAFRDNTLSLADPAFDPAMMDVDLPAFTAAAPGGVVGNWGNERVFMSFAVGPPDGTPPRRDDPRFLEQMAYYYVDHALARLEGLGYHPFDEPVEVRSHQPPTTPYTPPSPSLYPDAWAVRNGGYLFFHYRAPSPQGQGGMGSTAEDADIVVHELGHFVHFALAPQVTSGEVLGAYMEGTSDLFAALLLDDLSNGVGDDCFAEWVSTYYPETIPSFTNSEGYTCLRVLRHDFVWPRDAFGEIHRDGMFWAGPMWDVRTALGTNVTLRLLLEALPLLPESVDSFTDLAHAVLLADGALYRGRHEATIRESFAAKGINTTSLQGLLGGSSPPEPQVADPAWTNPDVAPTLGPAPAQESPGIPAGVLLAALVAFALAVARSRR